MKTSTTKLNRTPQTDCCHCEEPLAATWQSVQFSLISFLAKIARFPRSRCLEISAFNEFQRRRLRIVVSLSAEFRWSLGMTISLLVIMFLFIGTGASAVTLTSQAITEKVKSDITASLKQLTSGRIEVATAPLPYPSINLPQGKVEIKTEFSPANLRSSSLVRTSIYVNGINVRNFGVKADIKVYDKVWVATDWINKGSALGSLKYEEKEVSQILEKLPEKGFSPSGYIARKSIAPGEVIVLDCVEGLPAIVQNSPVSVIFKTPKISVTIPATALTSGRTGDFIKVRSDAYRKIYVGRIIGDNLVLVNI